MKNFRLITIVLVVLVSCGKDTETKPDYFKEPILDWSGTKEVIKSKESRTLLSDYGAGALVWLSDEFESGGSGVLEYSGESPKLTMVSYDFFCNAETLVQVNCKFLNNSDVKAELREFMVQKYGNIYEEFIDGDEFKLTWEKSGMTIKLYGSNYGVSVLYRKKPLY